MFQMVGHTTEERKGEGAVRRMSGMTGGRRTEQKDGVPRRTAPFMSPLGLSVEDRSEQVKTRDTGHESAQGTLVSVFT